SLYNRGFKQCQSMKAIGYKEFIPYFEGQQTLEECIEQLKQNSRRFAKRQYTWFKNKMDVNWYEVHPNQSDKTFQKILKDLAGFINHRSEERRVGKECRSWWSVSDKKKTKRRGVEHREWELRRDTKKAQ